MKDILSKKGEPMDCTAAVMVKNGRILLGLRHYTPDKWKSISVWTVPGGRCDQGESIEVTLRRETKEEIGAEDMRIVSYLGTFPGAKDGDILHVFHCNTDAKPRLMEPEKFEEWRWFAANEIPDNFINPSLLGIIHEVLAKTEPIKP